MLVEQVEQMLSINEKSNIDDFCVPGLAECPSDIEFVAQLICENLNEVINEDLNNTQPVFLNIKQGFIKNLAMKIVNNPKKPIIIGVTGESASGKTTLALNTLKACLSDERKGFYTLIACDDYFHDASKELEEAGSYESLFATGFSFDTPEAVNLDLMRHDINNLASGKCVYSPEYDFVTCASIPNNKEKRPAKVILAEGLFTLNEKIREVLDIAIYVHTPSQIIKERWYKRAISRGKTGKAADMMYENVNREAQKYVRPTMETADIILSGLVSSQYNEFMADKIIQSIKNSLEMI
jgi:uridine kinase